MISKLIDRLFHRKVVYGAEFFGEQWFSEWDNLKNVLYTLIHSEPRWNSILDFGCGPGVMLDYMNDRNYEYIGCDSSVEAKRLYHSRFGRYPHKYYSSLEDIIGQGFDLMLSFDVLEHMRDDEIVSLLSKTCLIREVLVNISRQRGIPGHVNIKSDNQWIEFFASNSFKFETEKTNQLRNKYKILRLGCPDLWNKNLFLFSRLPST